MMAAAKNRPQAARLLMNAGADTNTPDVYGWTPLMRAAYGGRREIVALLIDHGKMKIHTINDHGQSALHLAVIGRRQKIAELLLASGANQGLLDFAGRTPLNITKAVGLEIKGWINRN